MEGRADERTNQKLPLIFWTVVVGHKIFGHFRRDEQRMNFPISFYLNFHDGRMDERRMTKIMYPFSTSNVNRRRTTDDGRTTNQLSNFCLS